MTASIKIVSKLLEDEEEDFYPSDIIDPDPTWQDLDTFTKNYILAALSFSTDADSRPLDRTYSSQGIFHVTLRKMAKDCKKFQAENGDAIGYELREAGINFYLSRNRHGSGFWDSDAWPDDVRTRLNAAAHAYGGGTSKLTSRFYRMRNLNFMNSTFDAVAGVMLDFFIRENYTAAVLTG